MAKNLIEYDGRPIAATVTDPYGNPASTSLVISHSHPHSHSHSLALTLTLTHTLTLALALSLSLTHKQL